MGVKVVCFVLVNILRVTGLPNVKVQSAPMRAIQFLTLSYGKYGNNEPKSVFITATELFHFS